MVGDNNWLSRRHSLNSVQSGGPDKSGLLANGIAQQQEVC
jgi:hypothetical protein